MSVKGVGWKLQEPLYIGYGGIRGKGVKLEASGGISDKQQDERVLLALEPELTMDP